MPSEKPTQAVPTSSSPTYPKQNIRTVGILECPKHGPRIKLMFAPTAFPNNYEVKAETMRLLQTKGPDCSECGEPLVFRPS